MESMESVPPSSIGTRTAWPLDIRGIFESLRGIHQAYIVRPGHDSVQLVYNYNNYGLYGIYMYFYNYRL